MKVTGGRGRRCKQLLVDLKKTRRYFKLTEEALYCSLWELHFEGAHGTVS